MSQIDNFLGEPSRNTAHGGGDIDAFLGKDAGGPASDLAKSVKVGVQRLPGMVAGLADLPVALTTGARPFTAAADALGEATGFQPGKWADETKFSAGYEQGKKAVDEAWKDGSAGDIALSYLKNPGYTANQVAESLPSMVAGGLAGRALMGVGRVAAPAARAGGMGPGIPGLAERALGKWAAPVAGGVGEGAVTAGQQMAQYQGEDQQQNALASLGAGVGTGLIGIGAGRVANALGLETAETAIAKVGTGVAKAADEVPLSLKRRVLGGMVSEALLQELPQSAQEQMWQNWADGKPLMEGVARAATEGAIAGGVMGAGANVSDGGAGKRRAQAEQQARQNAEAAAASAEALTQETLNAKPLMLGSSAPDRLYVFPDGTVGRTGEVESYLASLPEEQRAEARAKLMGQLYTEVNDPQAQQARRWWENYGDGQAVQPPDYLAEVQQAVRSGTPFTTQQTVETVRSAMEDAWLAQNVGAAADAAPPAQAADTVGAQLQGAFDQAGEDAALAAVDARVRTGRILAGLQNIIDAGGEGTAQVLGRLNEGLARINEAPLAADESARVRRMLDARAAFTGQTTPSPLPDTAPRAVDAYADNTAMEALIPERPSQRMGIDPAAGPLSKAAATAVDAAGTAAAPLASPAAQSQSTANAPANGDVLQQVAEHAAQAQAAINLEATFPQSTAGKSNGAQADRAQQAGAPAAQGLSNGATPTLDIGAQEDPQVGPPAQAQGAGPGAVAAVPVEASRPSNWRTSMLGAVPVAKALGIEHKGKRLAQVVAEIDARDSERNQPLAQAQQAQPATEDVAQQSPQDFIPAPHGGLDYGEITPDMGKAMRRQAGKIRLQHGVQNADGTGWGVVHIEARHGKEIRSAGFESVEQFLADAFPANEKYVARKEKKEGWKPLWSRHPVPADASGASGFVGQSPEAGETTPTVSGQSGTTSVPPTDAVAQPATRADVEASPQQAAARIDTTSPGSKLNARQAQEAGFKAREEAKKTQRQAKRTQAAPEDTGLRVGVAPGSANPVTVRDGVVLIGDYEAVNYDTGEPVTVPKGSTRADVAQALKNAGALSSRQKMFGLGDKAQDVMFSRAPAAVPAFDFAAMRAAVLGSEEGLMSPEQARAILALRRPARATKESVHAALRQLVGGLGLLPNRLGRVVVATAAEIKRDWEPLIGRTGMEASDAGEAQGFYDPKSRTVFLIADHINAGDELGVVAHELMHKHGQAVLGEEGWNQLHSAIEGWANAPDGSMEQRVYEEALDRVQASRPAGADVAGYSSQELFPYAVQVALEMGVKPNLLAKPGTVERWLGQVRAALRQVWEKITRKPEQFKAQDLVNLAFGIAQRENPEHRGELDGAISSMEREIRMVIDAARKPGGHAPQKAALGTVSDWLAREARDKADLDLAGFSHVLDGSAVRHIIKNHFDEKTERSRGQLPVTEADLQALPFVVARPDRVVFGTQNRLKRDQVAYVKRMPDGTILYLEEVRTGRAELAAVSLRKYPATMNVETIVSTLHPNAQGDGGNALIVLTPPDAGNRPMFSRAAPTPKPGAAGWNAPAASWFDDLIYKLQDKHIDTKRALETIRATGKAIADDRDVYLQEELYHGRAAKRAEDFVNNELQPLMTYMSSVGLKMQDVQDYLHARHAKEANAVIAQRNPKLPDGGSGMTNAEADAVLASFNGIRRTQLARAAAQVDAIVAGTRQTFVDYGLESQDTVDGWAKTFAHYVPLMREQDGDGMAGLGTGQGFSVKGREVKGRTGSTRKVVDILANIALQRERAIVRGEKNRVATALVGLAKDNPSTLWQVDVVPTRQTLDKKTGMVTTQHDPLYKQRDNVVVAKIPALDKKTGKVVVKEHAVVFNENDARAMRMATALKNLDAPQMEGLLGATAQVTRYMAAINTQYNPIFGVTNLARDVQDAALNLASTPLAGKQREVLGQTLSALAGIYSDERARTKGKRGTASPWAKLWEEFQSVGGQTGYRDQFRTSADRGQALVQALDPSAWTETKWGQFFTVGGRLKVPMEMVRKAMAPVFAWLDDYNTAMENGVRLAAYKTALDAGMSKERAASLAKNLTTNFNRKGQSATQVGALYAFFNASVQGTARIGQTLFDMEPGQPKTLRLSSLGKKIVAGGVLLGSLQAVLLAAAGFDDEEPADFVRERNLVIPNPFSEKGYVTIPMPLGFHVLPNLGRIPTEFVLGGFKNPAEHVIRLMGLFADTFNPIGNAGLSMQTLAPTVLDPIAALAENKDFSGRKIAKESFDQVTPGHALARDTATAPAKWLAEAINWLSGGTAHTRGAFSPTPDQIDYLIGQATGGVGRELSKLQQSVVGAAQGDDVPWHKVPLVGRFYGDAGSDSAKQSAYYRHLEAVQRHAAEVKGLRLEKKPGEAQAYLQKHPEARWHLAANAAQRNIRELQKQRRELEQQGAPREQVRVLEQRIVARMERFSALVQG